MIIVGSCALSFRLSYYIALEGPEQQLRCCIDSERYCRTSFSPQILSQANAPPQQPAVPRRHSR